MLTNLEQFKPADFQHQVNTLKDMEQILHQYRDGLLTEAETLLAVQMTRAQAYAACVHRSLPLGYQHVSLEVWDRELEGARLKAEFAADAEVDATERVAGIEQFSKSDGPEPL
jgi:hypothetical protein